jgi:DNA-binding FadR family transcriptional regulator
MAISSGNYVYPLLINSFRDLYTNLTREFFSDRGVVKFVKEKHRELFEAVKNKDADLSVKVMTAIIDHGEKHLHKNIETKDGKVAG